jgi:hypothetical protein
MFENLARLPLQGESVLAVRQNWNVYCIRKGVCLESVGALPFTNETTNRTGRIPV